MLALMSATEPSTVWPDDSGTSVRSTLGKKVRLALALVKSQAVTAHEASLAKRLATAPMSPLAVVSLEIVESESMPP